MNAVLLIVDDDPDSRNLLDAFLRGEGYAPILAADGHEALAMLEAQTPDLILLDAVMPGLDGFETCRLIKRHAPASHVPVIFMTGLSDTEHVVRGLDAGGVDYITKPLVLDELAARIRVHIGNARATRSAVSGLERVGARLVSCNDAGTLVWAAPEAARLLDGLDATASADLQHRLAGLLEPERGEPAEFTASGSRYVIVSLGDSGDGHHLFRLDRSFEGIEADLLREAFGLTPREAEVLLWTSRGKSNKDMSEILNISARTVNKHLEQIFIKVGVENRASAASAATTVLLTA